MGMLVAERQAQSQALKDSRRRVISALVACSVYVDEQAALGDLLAQVLLEEIEAAFDGLAAENIAATTILYLPDEEVPTGHFGNDPLTNGERTP